MKFRGIHVEAPGGHLEVSGSSLRSVSVGRDLDTHQLDALEEPSDAPAPSEIRFEVSGSSI